MDNDNNIWIGTANGLSKFNGTDWEIFNTTNSPLPYRVISSLDVDKQNILWIGCGHFTAGGILSFDGNNWMLYTKENSALPSSIIYRIYVDENDNKLVGTAEGLVIIDNQDKWNVFTGESPGYLCASVNAVAADLDNNVWVGSNELLRLDFEHYYGCLQKYDGENWIDFRPHPNGEYNPDAVVSNRVDHIIHDKYGFLLIATETEGEYPYNLSFFKNGRWQNLSDLINDFPSNLFIRDLKIDNNDVLWLATQQGIISVNYFIK